MHFRPFLLVAALSALLLPAAASAAGQTPTAAGYSAADVPALAVLPAAASGRAADDPGRTVLPATAGACAAGGAALATGSPTAAGYGSGVAPSQPGAACLGGTTDCATGASAAGAVGAGGAQGAGAVATQSTSLRVYDGGSLSVMTLEQPAIVARRAANVSGAQSELLAWPNAAPVSTPVASGAHGTRVGCAPNPCLAASSLGNGGRPILSDSADGSLVLRLPFGSGLAEAVLGGLLLAASACGAAAFVVARRRRRRPAPNPLW